MTPRPPSRTPSRYIRELSRQKPLNLSRLPKLPPNTPPIVSRGILGHFDQTITSNQNLKAVDDDFARAVRLEVIAEKGFGTKALKSVARFPIVRMPDLDIRMAPKKLLVVKEQVHSQRFSKNSMDQRFTLSLALIASKSAVHRFDVVRGRIKTKIAAALDLILRRGTFTFPKGYPAQPGQPSEPQVKDNELSPKISTKLLHHPVPVDLKAWVLPDWMYAVYPRPGVFRMPLPDLVHQLHLGMEEANRGARAWQDRYTSPETGEFVPVLSKPAVDSPPEPNSPNCDKLWPKRRKAKESKAGQFRGPPPSSPDARRTPLLFRTSPLFLTT